MGENEPEIWVIMALKGWVNDPEIWVIMALKEWVNDPEIWVIIALKDGTMKSKYGEGRRLWIAAHTKFTLLNFGNFQTWERLRMEVLQDNVQVELDEMKKRLKEMEEEAATLREMQAKVEKGMSAVQVWEGRAYDYCMDNLKNMGIPVDGLAFDPELVIRGLVIDKQKGNLVKADCFGYVKRAMHGTSMLSTREMCEIYGRELVDLRKESRWVFLNTLFSVSEAVAYMQERATMPAVPWALTSKQQRTNSDLQHRRPWFPRTTSSGSSNIGEAEHGNPVCDGRSVADGIRAEAPRRRWAKQCSNIPLSGHPLPSRRSSSPIAAAAGGLGLPLSLTLPQAELQWWCRLAYVIDGGFRRRNEWHSSGLRSPRGSN
nr:Cytosolic purine 5'-nucleotidase [Ipomoea batatas]